MWKIDNNFNITMTKGDTPSFKINLTTKDEEGQTVPYEVQDDDVIMFAVKEMNGTDVLISLEIPHDTLILKIPQNQTKFLGTGKYTYEISINNTDDDFHDTFIADKILELTNEVY